MALKWRSQLQSLVIITLSLVITMDLAQTEVHHNYEISLYVRIINV